MFKRSFTTVGRSNCPHCGIRLGTKAMENHMRVCDKNPDKEVFDDLFDGLDDQVQKTIEVIVKNIEPPKLMKRKTIGGPLLPIIEDELGKVVR